MPRTRLAVLGKPVSGSLSPLLHRAAYAYLGQNLEYEAIEVGLEDWPEFWSGLKQNHWLGFSVTMPLKSMIARQFSPGQDLVVETGVANTLVFRQGWSVFNTDVAGLNRALIQAGLDGARSVAVLGSGATATNALFALAPFKPEVLSLYARNHLAARTLASLAQGLGIRARSFGLEEFLAREELTLSALPAGAAPALPKTLDSDLFDVNYRPWPSELALRWRAAGGRITGGLGMLVEQALDQIKLFLGQDPSGALESEASLRLLLRQKATEVVG